VLPQSRRKQQTAVGFLSLVGGFFGLFAGFSALSGFELLFCIAIEPLIEWFRTNDSRVYPVTADEGPVTVSRSYCNNFFSNSSIHGFNHIGNYQKTVIERYETFRYLAMLIM
jgi:hypothetical protein